jgi:hypothetical protein
MSKQHQAFVFNEAAFRRDLAPIFDRQDAAALESFLHDHKTKLTAPEPRSEGESEGGGSFAERAAWALSAYYNADRDIGLGSVASKCRFALMDLYPEGRVFVGGGVVEVAGGHFQSAEYVAGSVQILEHLRAEHPLKADVIDPVLNMLHAAASAGQGLYLTPAS